MSEAARARPVRIIALGIVAAVVYGVLHDQITVRVCVEYFTVGHPRVFDTDSPTLLGLGWGVIATWWVGLILGGLLAFAATRGPRPPRTAASLIRPLARLLAVTASVAVAAGLLGWYLATQQWVVLVDPLATLVPRDHHAAFIADLWAHSASYLAAFVGGLVLINRVWKSRGPRSAVAVATHTPHSPPP